MDRDLEGVMEHAEAHERLSDLALEPGSLAALESDPSPGNAALLAHVEVCDRCTADLAGWRRTWWEVGRVARSGDTADEPGARGLAALGAGQPIRPPMGLRSRILAAVHADPPARGRTVPAAGESAPAGVGQVAIGPGRATAAEGGSRSPDDGHRLSRRRAVARPWLVAAAALLVAVGAIAAGWLRTAQLDQLEAQRTELAGAVATMDRVLAAEPFWTVALRTADGTPGGTLAWSSAEVVVITSGLPPPGPGQAYRCWLERDGNRTPMGWMAFAGSTGYWAGRLSEYDRTLQEGGRFGVSLVLAGGGATPVLVGEL
jgi:hypothetical protein